MIPKPPECAGCVLFDRGQGFARPYGNPDSPLIVIAEALGANEAAQGEPLVGEAGVYWNRALSRLGVKRSDLYVGNTIQCRPSNNWLAGAPWEASAIRHCFAHRKKFYLARGTTYLTMGLTATKTVLKEALGIDYSGELENWHGYVIGKRPDGPFVVPCYHPSYILQGNHDLFGAFLFAIKRAVEVSTFGFHSTSDPSIVVDPPPSWFADFVSRIPDDPLAWLAVDFETTADFSNKDRIHRVNLSMHPDQGVTVPNEERYRFAISRALLTKATKLFWNERFDLKEAAGSGYSIAGETIDGMWGWHMLQSGLPKGLGFVASFYSDIEPWKHLRLTEPGPYAALDPLQTMRVMLGLKRDLTASGQWETFLRYATRLDHQAIYPMEKKGILISRPSLQGMQRSLEFSIKAIAEMIDKQVPEEALPWEGGWKRQPTNYPNAFLGKKLERVIVCTACGEKDVTAKHTCAALKEKFS